MIYKGELVKHTLHDPVVSLKLLDDLYILEVLLADPQCCLEVHHGRLLEGLTARYHITVMPFDLIQGSPPKIRNIKYFDNGSCLMMGISAP